MPLYAPDLVAVSASNNLYSSGTVVLSGGANVTVGTNGQTITISAAAGGGAFSGGVSTGGNAAGATGVTGTRLVFVGTNNITLSQTTGAAGGTISISGQPSFSAGVSNLGNTAGSTGVSGTRLVLVGSQNMSLSQSTDANGATVSFSAAAGGGGGFSAGVSNLGNTAGSTGVSGTRLVFVGTNLVTLSQSTDANGATVTIADRDVTASHWDRGMGSQFISIHATSNGTYCVYPLVHGAAPFPARITANTMGVAVSFSGSTAQSASVSGIMSSTIFGGVYTFNAGTLSLLNSFSATFGNSAANANNTSNWHGIRFVTVHSSAWSSTPEFVPGSIYWMGTGFRSHLSSCPASAICGYDAGPMGSGIVGVQGPGAIAASWQTHTPFKGRYSATTSIPPTAIQMSQLSGSGTGLRLEPLIRFDMSTYI